MSTNATANYTQFPFSEQCALGFIHKIDNAKQLEIHSK